MTRGEGGKNFSSSSLWEGRGALLLSNPNKEERPAEPAWNPPPALWLPAMKS